MTDDMNRTELTLLLALGLTAMVHAGRITTDAGYTDVGEDDRTAIKLKIEDLLTSVIVAMRTQHGPTTIEDISLMTHEVAAGAVRLILGEPPSLTAMVH